MYKTFQIENDQLKVIAVDVGASIYQIYFKKDGKLKPMLATPKTLDLFIENTLSYGRTIGRTAGRLYQTKETSKYVDFKGEPHLMHGGANKFSTKTFSVKTHTKDMIVFELEVADKSDAYRGNLKVLVTYRLFQGNLIVWHQANTDEDTLLNMTFHPYFNLDQQDHLKDHELKIESKTYLGLDEHNQFKYELDVLNTHRDYQTFKPLNINKENQLDDIYLLPKDRFTAILRTKEVELKVYTNYHALVVYTQNKVSNTDLAHAKKDQLHTGIAIECQKSQKELNVLKHDRVYDHYTMYSFTHR